MGASPSEFLQEHGERTGEGKGTKGGRIFLQKPTEAEWGGGKGETFS
jgi:hypothetical protein